jgi:N6-L-threonylcarbamoyladenine synthase
MRILAIETSCDETGIALLECSGTPPHITVTVLGEALYSQVLKHIPFGGVYPNLARREHEENLVPILIECLRNADALTPIPTKHSVDLAEVMPRESVLQGHLEEFFNTYTLPPIDLIAVTEGPGLEPALWVGIALARALSEISGAPIQATNHMEGHALSALLENNTLCDVEFPVLSLLVSGGHTELVLSRAWGEYEVVGETKDDAAGEAFDKVARMLGLPYPGGPEIDRCAREAREKNIETPLTLPVPMQHSKEIAFSFSGLKTAVLYGIQKLTDNTTRALTDDEVLGIARGFEDVAITSLVGKTRLAVSEYAPATLVVAGGVAANNELKRRLTESFPGLTIMFPPLSLATDNAVMIGLGGYMSNLRDGVTTRALKAESTKTF